MHLRRLRRGNTPDQVDQPGTLREYHGRRSRQRDQTAEYRIWVDMRHRCRNPNALNYHRYGGRGIKVCARWDSFEAFLADMGPRPSPDYSLERKNNDGDYSPENCCWATRSEQMRNTRQAKPITWNGETLLIVEWAERTGIDPHRIYCRIYVEGWPIERALTEPVAPRTRRTQVHWPKDATKPQQRR
jgi:hypothetical protein